MNKCYSYWDKYVGLLGHQGFFYFCHRCRVPLRPEICDVSIMGYEDYPTRHKWWCQLQTFITQTEEIDKVLYSENCDKEKKAE